MRRRQDRASFVVIGDVMVDTFARSPTRITMSSDQPATISRHLGGQGANTAAWLGWLGRDVTLIAAGGSDDDATWARRILTDGGVLADIHTVSSDTGQCVVIVDAAGDRTMFSDPGANRRIGEVAPSAMTSLLDSHDPALHLHLSGYLLERDRHLAGSLLVAVDSQYPAVTTSIDTAALTPNEDHRRGLETALPYLHLLAGTLEELALLAGLAPAQHNVESVIHHYRDRGHFSGTLVLKRGALGAVADNPNQRLHCPARSVDVVDTTGAGDAFSAGFLAAWTLDQEDLAAALDAGIQAASIAVTHPGAGPPPSEGR